MVQVAEIAFESGVNAVSAFIFSIDNYKRSDSEVSIIMNLICDEMATMISLCRRYNAAIQFCGQRELVEPRIREVFENACEQTKHGGRSVCQELHLALAASACCIQLSPLWFMLISTGSSTPVLQTHLRPRLGIRSKLR